MEIDECSGGGDSGAEEEEDETSTHGSRSDSSSSNISGSSTTTDSEDDSAEDQATSSSESHSSPEEDEAENENAEYMVNVETPNILRWETCVAANTKVKLPQDLCEHFSIFKEMLDPRFWNEYLTESQREALYNFLPIFPNDCNIEAQMEKSLRMLFNRENDRFGVTALDTFHNHLSAGHYRPDIYKICRLIRHAQKKRLLFEERKRSYELASQLLKSRESLLSNAYKQGFSQPTNRALSKFYWRKPKPIIVEEKTQLRYLEELIAVRGELGSHTRLSVDTTSENEENYPHYQTTGAKQKRKRRSTASLGLSVKGLQFSHEDETIRPVFSTLQRMEYASSKSLFVREQTEETYRTMLSVHKKRRAHRDIHPELNTQGIALADLTQRSQIGQKHKFLIGSTKITPKKKVKLEQNSLCQPTIKLMNSHSVKHESDNSDYSHTTDDNRQPNTADVDYNRIVTPIKLEPIDTYEVHQLAKKKINLAIPKSNKLAIINTSEIKKEVEDIEYDAVKTELSSGINENMLVETEEEEEKESKKELDLDNIDMMQLPIQLDDGIDILDDVKCEDESVMSRSKKEVTIPSSESININNGAELMQETHACFFSLLRDAFTSKGEYRMSATEMKEAVMQWQGNPISPLNDWYSLVPSWSTLIPLALGFLAGELTYSQDSDLRQERDQELVPYLENKGQEVYAWIGAGRDSDTRLQDLCTKFLLYKDALVSPITSVVSTATVATVKPQQIQHTSLNNSNTNSTIMSGTSQSVRSGSPVLESVSIDANIAGTEWEPPRALFPTEWKVRPSTLEEREEFRRQERMRYATPHKAFTYRMHGYASVVGPVKGIYQHNIASGQSKARGHNLLVADRPNFVTILALVRDATARLPNGEGTRADICQLLKDSQYIKEQGNNDDNLHSVVSGALDRLHYEADPCVKFYSRRKEWLYLHRARSESEFEMFHQQLQGVAKNKKNVGNTSRNKSNQPILKSTNTNKEQSNSKEVAIKKERRTTISAQPVMPKKEQRKIDEKVIEYPTSTEESINNNVEVAVSTIATSAISITESPVSVTSLITSPATITSTERDNVTVEAKSQLPAITTIKKAPTVGGKPIAVVKTNATHSLLQSNQHNFPHHQIQVSTSAGLQTIRLSGHSVLQSAQQSAIPVSGNNVTNGTTNLTTILPSTKVHQNQQQPTIITNQAGKSILQSTNMKQQQSQQQHVLPGKTLLASQIKLVSSSQIKSLLTSHGIQGQTIFIKQSPPSANQSQQQLQQQQQQQQLKQQLQHQLQQQRVVASQQQSIQQTPGMQRIFAQIGGKPIAVQIQQSSHQHQQQQQQQQQQQKILAKVLTNSGGGQIISVEGLLAQKGLKLATTTAHSNQLNRQGKQVIQAQYQVVPQAQTSPGQSKIIAVSTQHQQSQSQQAPTVRMVTAQLAGKPIVLASNKNVGVAVNTSSGNVVLGKQPVSQQSQQQPQQQQQQAQQPIILPSQLLNIKTLHGLKVIPTPTGLKTAGSAVYARVIAPTTIASTQAASNQQQTLQTQSSRNTSYSTP